MKLHRISHLSDFKFNLVSIVPWVIDSKLEYSNTSEIHLYLVFGDAWILWHCFFSQLLSSVRAQISHSLLPKWTENIPNGDSKMMKEIMGGKMTIHSVNYNNILVSLSPFGHFETLNFWNTGFSKGKVFTNEWVKSLPGLIYLFQGISKYDALLVGFFSYWISQCVEFHYSEIIYDCFCR